MTMKALILDGSVEPEPTLSAAYEVIHRELQNAGWEIRTCVLREMEIAYCAGCFGCWVKTPGVCMIDDAGREIVESAMKSDLMALLTPVTFGGYSSEMKKALDRMIPILSPFFTRIKGEVHHVGRYEKYPSLIHIGTLPAPDQVAEDIFLNLVTRNAINMHSPSHAAAVLSPGSSEVMKSTVRELLRQVGVRR
jgi:multimeric flavodoxin WrbA